MPTINAIGGPPGFPQTTVSSPLGDMIADARGEVDSLVQRIRSMNPDPLSDAEMEVLVARMANEQQGIADASINSIDLGTTPFALAGMLASDARSRQRSAVDVGSADIRMREREMLFRNQLSQGSLEANALGLDLSAIDLRERAAANARASAAQFTALAQDQQRFNWQREQAETPRLDWGPYGPQPSSGQSTTAFGQAQSAASNQPGKQFRGGLSTRTGGGMAMPSSGFY